jgi:hypothetical protein
MKRDVHRDRLADLGCALAGALSLAACGGSDDGSGRSSGTVTEQWAEFCTATFTRDTRILDVFDEPMFTAREGEAYLLANYSSGSGELLYLTDAGPEPFEVRADDAGTLPFTSTCEPDAAFPYAAVFDDVTVYAEEALTTRLCDLAAGTARPSTGGPRGFSIVGDISLSGPQTYEIYLDALSELCGGSELGYVSVPRTHLFGADTWLVPIVSIVGPE